MPATPPDPQLLLLLPLPPPPPQRCVRPFVSPRTAASDWIAPQLTMKRFNLTPSNSSLRAASEFNSLKRSAKAFSLKKASLNFQKSINLTSRRSHDGLTSNSTHSGPPVPPRAGADIPESPYGDDVICISREDTFDSSSVDGIPHDELPTPSTSPYASSYSSSSSSTSSYHLLPEIDGQLLSPVNEALDEYNPRRGSQLSMNSSWVDHHLQELDLSYAEDAIRDIEIVTTDDGFLSRKDSFILPPGETLRSYRRTRNLPIIPAKPFPRMSRPLPSTPPASPGLESRRVRPLPPPPYTW